MSIRNREELAKLADEFDQATDRGSRTSGSELAESPTLRRLRSRESRTPMSRARQGSPSFRKRGVLNLTPVSGVDSSSGQTSSDRTIGAELMRRSR